MPAGAIAGTLLVLYALLRFRSQRRYRRLLQLQEDLLTRHPPTFEPATCQPVGPGWAQRPLVTIPDFLPPGLLARFRSSVLGLAKSERSHIPLHKKGGTVSYETLHAAAPELVLFYRSPLLLACLSRLLGIELRHTPIGDQSSCSVLIYDRPKDHIGWHYDHNFYRGRHFTVLLPLVNEHRSESRCSSANLEVQINGREEQVPTPPNTLVVFEGARVLHRVTRLGPDETRLLLSMTLCTDERSSLLKGMLRRFKDVAYFGIRALWS